MPSGGSRKRAGRKKKWDETSMKVGVPSSIGNDLITLLERFYEKGIRGKELINLLNSVSTRTVKKYSYPASAGANSTSSAGGDFMDADDEDFNLFAELIPNPDNTVVIPVVGDSMIDIGIYPDDWLIVELINPLFQQPNEKDIVIASINDEVLVKRYVKEQGKIVLLSENKEHLPICESEASFSISGIVRNVIRRNL